VQTSVRNKALTYRRAFRGSMAVVLHRQLSNCNSRLTGRGNRWSQAACESTAQPRRSLLTRRSTRQPALNEPHRSRSIRGTTSLNCRNCLSAKSANPLSRGLAFRPVEQTNTGRLAASPSFQGCPLERTAGNGAAAAEDSATASKGGGVYSSTMLASGSSTMYARSGTATRAVTPRAYRLSAKAFAFSTSMMIRLLLLLPGARWPVPTRRGTQPPRGALRMY
jgi:hypothetical protein